MSENSKEAPTVEEAQEVYLAHRQARINAVRNGLNKLLEEYNCRIHTQPRLEGNAIMVDLLILPND
ncbi:MAG: hypothetical protein ACXABY_11635 [Candidatus Thorarchaeota archaeon]